MAVVEVVVVVVVVLVVVVSCGSGHVVVGYVCCVLSGVVVL